MEKIQTFLWFDTNAEEAANFYTSVFKNSKILSRMPGMNGKPMGLTVSIEDREFILFNGGPQPDWKFTSWRETAGAASRHEAIYFPSNALLISHRTHFGDRRYRA